MIGLCEYCGLKYADCKGNKDLEKLKCDYYKRPIVMNVKELAERVAELEIKLKDSVEVVRCKDCRWWNCKNLNYYHNNHLCRYWSKFGSINTSADDFCSYGERKGGEG